MPLCTQSMLLMSHNNTGGGGGALLYLTGMCEYEIKGNGPFRDLVNGIFLFQHGY